MFNLKNIYDYHLNGSKDDICGFEFEVFCLNNKYQRLYFYDNDKAEMLNIFDYLIEKEGFNSLNFREAIGVEKDVAKFTVEPGFQLEYSSRQNKCAEGAVQEFIELLTLYKTIKKRFDLRLLDLAMFPLSNIIRSKSISISRYEIMSEYFQNTGSLGRTMMQNTTSLQLTFSYKNQVDLEKK